MMRCRAWREPAYAPVGKGMEAKELFPVRSLGSARPAGRRPRRSGAANGRAQHSLGRRPSGRRPRFRPRMTQQAPRARVISRLLQVTGNVHQLLGPPASKVARNELPVAEVCGPPTHRPDTAVAVWASLARWSAWMAIGGACLTPVYAIAVAWPLIGFPNSGRPLEIGPFVHDVSVWAIVSGIGVFCLLLGISFRLIARHEWRKACRSVDAPSMDTPLNADERRLHRPARWLVVFLASFLTAQGIAVWKCAAKLLILYHDLGWQARLSWVQNVDMPGRPGYRLIECRFRFPSCA
jgi:hypothetical protein